MKVAIIDNDSSIREALIAQLKKYCPQVKNIVEASGVESGYELIVNEKPQLVFMDVEMDDGTGFDLVAKLKDYDFQLVFITAHNKYAITAFKFSAIDFLLKPIVSIDLVESVNKAMKGIEIKDIQKRMEVLQESLDNINNKVAIKKVALNDSNIIHYVRIEEIIYCKSDGPYTTFFIIGKRKVMVTRSLKEYEEMFEGLGFIRAHNSYLINVLHILRFNKTDNGELIMEENHSVPVSTRKREEVIKVLSRF